MRRLGIAAVGLALVVGIVGGVVGNPFDGTASAAPPKPTPTPQPVVEQNLDANGNIKVHEQGVVDVNVLNSSPSPGGRLIVLGTLAAVKYGNNSGEFPMVDVSDCAQMTAMAQASNGAIITFTNWGYVSPDGIRRVQAETTLDEYPYYDPYGSGIVDGLGTASLNVIGQHRYIQLRVQNSDAVLYTDITGWLWCAW